MRVSQRFVGTLAMIGIAVGLALPTHPAAAQTVGFVAATEGTAEVRSAGALLWEAALLDRDVAIGDAVRTGPDGSAKILLADDTILSIGEETELEIDRYVVGPAATRDPSVLQLLKGRARAVVGERFGESTRLEVHTPTAVIGVKGTAFDAYVLTDALRGLWTLVCNVEGNIFVDHVTQAGRVAPRVGFCAELYPDAAPGDEIPRPEWALPILGPSSGLTAPQVDILDPDNLPPVGAGPDVPDLADRGDPQIDTIEGPDQVSQDKLDGTGFPGGGSVETPPGDGGGFPGGGSVETPPGGGLPDGGAAETP